MMHKNKSVNVHQFAMVPRADIPRSSFKMQTAHKTTFDGGYLIPIFLSEVLPGDTFKLRMTAFARLSTPILPFMDNLHMDDFWFFVPYRLLWDNWKKFMGEQNNPGDSTSYTIPQVVSKASGYDINSLQDYMGLPTAGQVGAGLTVSHSALPCRAYNKIWNAWFRDENLQNSVTENQGDGPDTYTDFTLLRRGKRHDYFTSALPWPQKGSTSVSLPLGSTAPVVGDGNIVQGFSAADAGVRNVLLNNAGNVVNLGGAAVTQGASLKWPGGTSNPYGAPGTGTTGLVADLSAATAATINQIRQAFQIQRLLERDARGGTRYVELILAHFGVRSPDYRLQRPEYLGGGTTPINVTPIPQTSATGLTGGSTPAGNLAAVATGLFNGHGFTQSFTEHGIIMGLISVRADLTYQQGLQRFWSRSTRYDFYWPAFAMLGEQAVLSKEIYCDGNAADANVWGYQERWAEYRYHPPMITGRFRSTAASTLDIWHAAQKFTSRPTLADTFIKDTPPLDRLVAIGSSANGSQFFFDSVTDINATRPMPLYSVPGMLDHF